MKLPSIAEFFSNLFRNVSKYNVQGATRRNFIVNGIGLIITRRSSNSAGSNTTVEPSQMLTTSVNIDETVTATMIPTMIADNHWIILRKKPADFTSINVSRIATSASAMAMNAATFDMWSYLPFFIASIKNAAGTAVNYLPGLEYSHICIGANALQHRDEVRKNIPLCLSFGLCTLSGDWTNTFLKANLFVKKINEGGGIELTKVTEILARDFKTFGEVANATKFHLYTTIDKSVIAANLPSEQANLYHPHLYIEFVFQNYRTWTANIRLEESYFPSVATPPVFADELAASGALFFQKYCKTLPIVTGTSLTATTYTTVETGVIMDSMPTFGAIGAAWPTGGTPPTFASGANPSASGTYCLNFLPADGSSFRISCRDDTNGRSISQLEYRMTSNAVRFSVPLS